MNNIKALIIDDERPARKELLFLLKAYPEISIIGEADNISDAIIHINEKKPDLVFLDIQLTGENGFDLLTKIPLTFKVIFITAFDEYAIRAFDVNAADYLLKPVDPARLEISLKRLLANNGNHLQENKKFNYEDSIYIKQNNHFARFIEINSISVITSVGNYSSLETTDGNSYLILKTLKQWEEELPNNFFIRIHQSSIVNIKYIIKIDNYSKSHHRVFLKNMQEPLEISRYYYKNFRMKYT